MYWGYTTKFIHVVAFDATQKSERQEVYVSASLFDP